VVWEGRRREAPPYPDQECLSNAPAGGTASRTIRDHHAQCVLVRRVGAVVFNDCRDLGRSFLPIDAAQEIERDIGREGHAAASHHLVIYDRGHDGPYGAIAGQAVERHLWFLTHRVAPRGGDAAVQHAGRRQDQRAGADRGNAARLQPPQEGQQPSVRRRFRPAWATADDDHVGRVGPCRYRARRGR